MGRIWNCSVCSRMYENKRNNTKKDGKNNKKRLVVLIVKNMGLYVFIFEIFISLKIDSYKGSIL